MVTYDQTMALVSEWKALVREFEDMDLGLLEEFHTRWDVLQDKANAFVNDCYNERCVEHAIQPMFQTPEECMLENSYIDPVDVWDAVEMAEHIHKSGLYAEMQERE